jgi:hypothetical protein
MGAGELADRPEGWKCYAAYLAWQSAEGPAGKSKAYVNLSHGWALGGAGFKAALLRDHAVAVETRAWETQGVKEVRELHWHAALAKALETVAKTRQDAQSAPKSAEWKLALAAWMKAHTQAPNGWLGHQLNLGEATSLSSNLTRYRRKLSPTDELWGRLTQIFVA